MGVEAKAVNNNGICLACYNGSLSSVIDADLNNKVSMGNFAALVSGSGISVKNNITTYPQDILQVSMILEQALLPQSY
jgi:hypothetical protein